MAKKIKELVKAYYTMWNDGDFDKADTLMHSNIKFQGAMGFDMVGVDAFKEYAKQVGEAFPDLYHATEIVISEDERASVYVLYTGVHKGKLYDLEPTGNRIRYNGATFFTLDDDKFSKIRVLGDRYRLFEQLGIFSLEDSKMNIPNEYL